jgi:ribokinase
MSLGSRWARAGSTGRVAVVGAINLDLVVVASRLPGPGETVVAPGVQRFGGGKGANAAVAAARAGAAVAFLGAVGDDAAAGEAERDLRDAGVDLRGLARLPGAPTGTALIVVDPDGENQIAVGAGANGAVDSARLATELAERAADLDAVLVSTEIPGEAVLAAVAAAAAAGLTCVLNPAPPVLAVADALAHRPILTPNRGELAALLGMLDGDAPRDVADPEPPARALAARTGAPVIVTLGPDGVLVLERPDADALRIAAPRVDVRDATGAGDTFNGVLVAGLAAGAPLADAARRATAAASLSVGAPGARAGMPDPARIDALLAAASDRDGPMG